MKKNKIALLSFLLLLMIGTFLLLKDRKEEEIIDMSETFRLTNYELKKNKEEALKGNPGGIYELVMHYRIYESNHKEADKWLQLGVKYDLNWALRDYGYGLCFSKGKPKEGIKYLKRACEKNYGNACEEAKDCEKESK